MQEEQDYTLELEEAKPIAKFLVMDKDSENGNHGVFDTVTGEQLQDYLLFCTVSLLELL